MTNLVTRTSIKRLPRVIAFFIQFGIPNGTSPFTPHFPGGYSSSKRGARRSSVWSLWSVSSFWSVWSPERPDRQGDNQRDASRLVQEDAQTACPLRWWFVWFIWSIWFVLPNQINETDQTNQNNDPVLTFHASRLPTASLRR